MGQREGHPELTRNLVLIGGRGSGKSSVSKRIARANRHFMLFSLDALVRYEAGARTIPEIVEAEGWPGFRRREEEVVSKVAAFQSGALIDTGGGVVAELGPDDSEVYSKRKVEALRRHGLVVYLHQPVAYLESRSAADPNRPSLSSEQSFSEIMARRDPWYRRAAHHVVECDGRSKNDLASLIIEWFYREIGVL